MLALSVAVAGASPPPGSAASPGSMLLAAIVAIVSTSGRLAFDSLVQRDAPDANRGRSFASFELRFQLVWVVGAVIPVLVRIPLTVGFLAIAGVAGFALFTYAAGQRAARRDPADPSPPRRRPDRGPTTTAIQPLPDDTHDPGLTAPRLCRTDRRIASDLRTDVGIYRQMRASQRPGASTSAGVGSCSSPSQRRRRPVLARALDHAARRTRCRGRRWPG